MEGKIKGSGVEMKKRDAFLDFFLYVNRNECVGERLRHKHNVGEMRLANGRKRGVAGEKTAF